MTNNENNRCKYCGQDFTAKKKTGDFCNDDCKKKGFIAYHYGISLDDGSPADKQLGVLVDTIYNQQQQEHTGQLNHVLIHVVEKILDNAVVDNEDLDEEELADKLVDIEAVEDILDDLRVNTATERLIFLPDSYPLSSVFKKLQKILKRTIVQSRFDDQDKGIIFISGKEHTWLVDLLCEHD